MLGQSIENFRHQSLQKYFWESLSFPLFFGEWEATSEEVVKML